MDCSKGPASDKEAFALWVSELKAAFEPKGLLLSAAVSPSKKVMDAGYDIPSIARDLDWIAVMTYDYHGHWDKKTGHVAPMYAHPEDDYDYFNTVSEIFFPYKNGRTVISFIEKIFAELKRSTWCKKDANFRLFYFIIIVLR